MDSHKRCGDTDKGRVKRLYDRLASMFQRLSPERREAMTEHLHEQAEADDGRTVKESDPGQREERERDRR